MEQVSLNEQVAVFFDGQRVDFEQSSENESRVGRLSRAFFAATRLGEDLGVKQLSRLDAQTNDEYLAYQSRACFFNATRRAADAFVGLVFRKAPFVKVPDALDGIGKAMARFSNDADMLGTSLFGYAKNLVREVVSVGRAGTLVDWEDFEGRAYASAYRRLISTRQSSRAKA